MRKYNHIPQRQERQLSLFSKCRSRHGEPYQKNLLMMLARVAENQAPVSTINHHFYGSLQESPRFCVGQ
ncbi:hypothetical protein CPter291_2201 [Collimonas pratensis]|uniref:Uncharacterized protein n=1 Tax=Collimonas pratensis TaxID=279113 RepID=A0A127QXJ5_9BURK|nr:hypothetical protein CPter91_3176 [Collimonas pratensis]AMP14462.1 hypothetical protein CPter291_2201 [Collimonas pratensis]